MPRPFNLLLLGLLLTPLAGCGVSAALDDDDEEEDEVAQTEGASTDAELVTVTDPVEDAFTIGMPKGWQNLAYKQRSFDISKSVATSAAPDGTVIFLGDPALPIYFSPTWQYVNVTHAHAKVNPLIAVKAIETAEEFLPDYAKRKFGDLEGFTITASGPHPETVQRILAKHGATLGNFEPSAAFVNFTYQDGGTTMKAMLIGSVLATTEMWTPDVSGISTPGEPDSFYPLLVKMSDSYKVNPAWTAKEEQRNARAREAILEQGRKGRQALQNMAASHQARMDAIHAAGDASMRAYYQRDAASDRSHRNFLNQINEESTVAGSNGQQFQVSNAYDRYYMNKSDGTYVGGDAHTSLDDLRKRGLNPDDYEEVQVKR